MKHRIITLGTLALLAAPALAQGGRWVTVGSAPGGAIEVDRGSLTWHRMQHAVWRIRYGAPQPNGAVEERNAVEQAMFRRGVLVLGAGRNALRFAPPLVLSRDQADEVLRVFDEALTEVGGGSVGPAGRV